MPPTIPDSARDLIPRVVLTMRLILLALAMGIVSLGGFVVTSLLDKPLVLGARFEVLNLAMYALAAVMIGLRFVVPPLVFKAAKATPELLNPKNKISPEALPILEMLSKLQSAFIVGCALLEGAAFGNLTAAMITGDALHVIVAGVLLFLILLQFPTQNSVTGRIEYELARAEEDRQLQ